MLDSTMKTSVNPKWVQRTKWIQIDGTECEHAYLRTDRLNVDELEALGHEVLRVAAEWRKEIAERVPTLPIHKVFSFSRYGGDGKIATWVEHPWVLIRVGKGTSVAFLVKERNTLGTYEAWIVSAEKNVSGGLRWKRRFEGSTTVDQRDIIHVFPIPLPHSPSLGDLELARLKYARTARARAS
jgi:hypothetical protein